MGNVVASARALGLCMLAACHPDVPSPASIPAPTVSFHEDFPTVARVRWETAAAGVSWAVYGDELRSPPTGASTEHEVVVLGLPAGVPSELQVFTELADGTRLASEVMRVQPAPPPAEFPLVDVPVADQPAMNAAPFVLTTFLQPDGSHIALLDRQGRPVWWVKSKPGMLAAAATPSRDGKSVLYAEWDVQQVQDLGQIVRQPLDGSEPTVTRAMNLHHDFVELPDGQFGWIGMAFEDFEVDGVMTHVVVDTIVEAPEASALETPDEVWRYSDHQTPYETCSHFWDYAYGTLGRDWTHANSLTFDEAQGRYFVMSRHLDALHAVDRASGQAVWQLGGVHGEFDLHPEDAWSHGHYSDIWEDGLLVFDNCGHDAAAEGAPCPSRLVEYALDESAGTVDVAWTYEEPNSVHVPAWGDARKLDNGNVLSSWTTMGLMVELTPDGRTVWRAENELGYATGRVVLVDELYDLTKSQ